MPAKAHSKRLKYERVEHEMSNLIKQMKITGKIIDELPDGSHNGKIIDELPDGSHNEEMTAKLGEFHTQLAATMAVHQNQTRCMRVFAELTAD